MTLAETREKLRTLHAQAKAAGLTSVVTQVDISLAIASQLAITKLEAALADPALQAQHQAIVESFDAEPCAARPPIAPPRKPAIPQGAAPAIRMPALRPPPPQAPRRVTGPDKFDLEIPF